VKLLLDEMLSPAIARELRQRGHDAESVAGHPDREAQSDPEVLAPAKTEHRAIVTNNLRDFRPSTTRPSPPADPATTA
jgi:predicted nuclease of predicted toxin-antitoxin system